MKHTLRWLSTFGLIALMALTSVTTSAQKMYRWVDDSGNVYYSDQPPSTDVTELESISAAGRSNIDDSGAGADETSAYIEQEAEFQARRVEKDKADAKAKKDAEIAKQWDQNCDMARKNLEVLTNPPGGRLRETNADGTLVYVSDEKRQRQKAQASEDIKKWCKS